MLKKFYTLLLLCISVAVSFAQKKYPNTLLWRITGNGLQRPSYLFGTMHLQDRRIFYFGDSVYDAIEKTDGFAMEIDPYILMDSLFSTLTNSDTSPILKKLVSKKEFDQYAYKLEKRLGIPASKITIKNLSEERNRMIYDFRKPDDMMTIVDLYLFGIAERLGKWVGGIEDIEDQLSIKDELGKDFKLSDLFLAKDSLNRWLEWMVNVYNKQELDLIEQYILGSDSLSMDEMIVKRNHKMSQRIDSLLKIRKMFFAVGAAHLPGRTGLIGLLEAKGYMVEPVMYGARIPPEDYHYPKDQRSWHKLDEETYTAEMPGEPNAFLEHEPGDIKMYADLTTNIFYLTGFSPRKSTKSPDSVMLDFAKSISQNGKVLSKKDIEKDSSKGLKILVDSRKQVVYRFQLFYKNKGILFAAAGGQNIKNLQSSDVNKFLGSFKVKSKDLFYVKKRYEIHDSVYAFSISLPGMAKKEFLQTDSTTTTCIYSCFDNEEGVFYQVIVRDMANGYYLSSSDSAYFQDILDIYRANESLSITDTVSGKLGPWATFTIKLNSRLKSEYFENKVLNINRGNRTYSLIATYEQGKESYTTAFFNSFRLKELLKSNWKIHTDNAAVFSTWLPEKPQIKLAQEHVDTVYQAYDKFSANTYYIEKSVLPKYAFSESDSSFWKQKMQTLRLFMDSTFPMKFITHQNSICIEYAIPVQGNSLVQTYRSLLNGDTLYTLITIVPSDQITDPNHEKFFSEFRFTHRASSTLFTDKISMLLKDLASRDSAIHQQARDGFRDAVFTKRHIPLINEAIFKDYLLDTSIHYYSVNEMLVEQLGNLCDSSCIEFFYQNYRSIPLAQESLKLPWLGAMGKIKTVRAYNLLKELLINVPPKEGYSYELTSSLTDSLLLTKRLYPELLSLAGNLKLGMPIMYITSIVIDSGIVDKKILDDFEREIFELAKKRLESRAVKVHEYYAYDNDLLRILEIRGNLKSIELLRKFSELADIYIRKQALLSLLKLKQSVSTSQIEKIAADKSYRFAFYNDLKSINRQELFPVLYKTQLSIAESCLFSIASEDEDYNVINIKKIGERVILHKGKKQRFFLFKVSFDYEENKETYLGICGPFAMDKKNINTDNECTGIYYEKPFSPTNLDAYFRDHLKQIENEVDYKIFR